MSLVFMGMLGKFGEFVFINLCFQTHAGFVFFTRIFRASEPRHGLDLTSPTEQVHFNYYKHQCYLTLALG